MEIAVDATEWPVVLVTFPERADVSDVDKLVDRLDTIFRTRGPFALVADVEALGITTVTPLLRGYIAKQADRLARQGALIAEAVVVKNPVLRGLHRAYTWARAEQTHAHDTFENVEAARRWAGAHAQASQTTTR